jgi:hypothetical protein
MSAQLFDWVIYSVSTEQGSAWKLKEEVHRPLSTENGWLGLLVT